MNDDEQKLCHELDLAREIPVPADMQRRWHDSIDRAAQQEYSVRQEPARPFHFTSFFWGAAVTAALVAGIGIGAYLTGGPTTIQPNSYVVQDISTVSGAVPGAFTRGLQVHLRDTQQNIASMPIDTTEDRTLLVLQIIQQNRLFERAAEQNSSDDLARVLRAFEPILLRLAANDIAPTDAQALRDQLAFELKIMLTKLERDTSKDTQST